MKTIKRVNFTSFRNNEHFQFQTEFKALVQESNPVALKIDQLFTQSYLPLYSALDEAIIKIIKNTFSEARTNADAQRDSTFRGMDDTTRAGLNHFDPTVQTAAKRIRIPIETVGNVASKPLNEETSAIYNLIQELNKNYLNEIAALNLAPWLAKLDADNKLYEALVKSSYEEEAAKTELRVKKTRAEVDKAVRLIFERIEALIIIEGEAQYAELVRRLNLIVEKYANTLAQRQGSSAANKNKKKKTESTTPNDTTDDTNNPQTPPTNPPPRDEE